MSAKRIRNVVSKEWAQIARSPSTLLFGLIVPLAIVGQAIFLSWIIPRFAGPAVGGLIGDAAGGLDATARLRVLIMNQFPLFVLLVPAMVANVFATLSIVEEKVTGTLEPLLATPVRTGELLLGKILAGAIPAVAVGWGSAGVFVLAASLLGWAELFPLVLTVAWILSLALVTPAISILSFVIGVVGSSRASDVKSAQNLAVVIVLPIFALIAVQVLGLVRFDTAATILFGIGLFVVDAAILPIAVRLFGRESILVRWR